MSTLVDERINLSSGFQLVRNMPENNDLKEACSIRFQVPRSEFSDQMYLARTATTLTRWKPG